MSVQVEKLEKNMAKLTIEASAEDFEKACQVAYNKNKGKIQIAGFRKGKAPRTIIEKMYGKEVFYEDAANEIIPDAYTKAVKECGEEIVSQPTIDVVQIEAGKPFIFTAEVALKPEVTLGTYKGVKVEKIDVTVTDEEVEADLQQQRENSARSISVEDRPVKDGDETIIDFEGFVDGVAFEGGKGENYPLTIGSGAFIPGFEEQLVGAELNKEVEVNVTFPEDYQAEELAGKAAVFKCTVKEIKEKELPELDDEFASEVSEFDTLAEYKEDIKKKLTEKKEAEAKSAKEKAVIDAIIADAQMDIPDAMVAYKQRQMLDDFSQRMAMQGITFEQYCQFTGATPAMMLEQVKPQAESQIKTSLVLEAIAKAENIEVSEEDVNKEIEEMAKMYKMEASQIKDMMGDGETDQLKADLACQKALEFVVAQAKEAKKTTRKRTTKKDEAAKEEKAEENTEE